jgi:serine/threonine-protein kinase HipA
MLPDRLRQLGVSIAGQPAGQLLRHSTYEFRYQDARPDQPEVALQMPARLSPTWTDGDLFPAMDQNIPEGDLLIRLRSLFPKQPLTPMHLLALTGENGIGRLGFRLADEPDRPSPPSISRATLLATRYTPAVFDELVQAYLSTGAGIAGMQPKIMVPDRPTVPIPSLIVKAASSAYPGLAANEYLCLSAAQRAGVAVPTFDLSDDGQILVIDRFDLTAEADGGVGRLGFEDVAALGGLRVRDTLSDRKYHSSYERIADLLKKFMLKPADLARFFEQVAFTVMVRNGDGHLKNFGLLYRSGADAWLAPMFDVVTTAIYRYTQYPGGPELEDRTLALKLFAGRHHSKAYPTTDELLRFGARVCGVNAPQDVLNRIAEAMHATLASARHDERVPKDLVTAMAPVWATGAEHAR